MIQKIALTASILLIAACAAKKIEGEGTESREQIRAVIRQAMPEIKNCYDRELPNNPKLEGKIVISFTVGDLGKVIDSKIKNSTLKNQNVHQCVVAQITKQTFPQPPAKTTVVVDYPFVFSPNPAKTSEIPNSGN